MNSDESPAVVELPDDAIEQALVEGFGQARWDAMNGAEQHDARDLFGPMAVSIAARVRAEALREAAEKIAPNQVRPSNVIVVGARMTDDVLDMVRTVEDALVAAVRAEAQADAQASGGDLWPPAGSYHWRCAEALLKRARWDEWRSWGLHRQAEEITKLADALAAVIPESDVGRFVAGRVVAGRAEAVAEATDIYELRKRGVRVLGEEQCCELACGGGACASCPCCCAGWCVWGHDGEIPARDLTPQSDYRIWLDEAADHNPVAKLLAQIEGVAEVDYDEPAQPRSDVAEAVAAEQRRAVGVLLSIPRRADSAGPDHDNIIESAAFDAGVSLAVSSLLAAGSVPVATPERPEIVVLCGSTRFKNAFREAARAEALAGRIVLTVSDLDPRPEARHVNVPIDAETKARLDELHKRKIDLADRMLVLNVGGYIGESTRSEIEYATAHGKPISYLEPGPVATPTAWHDHDCGPGLAYPHPASAHSVSAPGLAATPEHNQAAQNCTQHRPAWVIVGATCQLCPGPVAARLQPERVGFGTDAFEAGGSLPGQPVATPTGHVHGFAISGRCVCGAVAIPTEPAIPARLMSLEVPDDAEADERGIDGLLATFDVPSGNAWPAGEYSILAPASPVPAEQPDGWGEGVEAVDHPVNCGCASCVIDRLRESNDSLREQLSRAVDEIDGLRAEQPEGR